MSKPNIAVLGDGGWGTTLAIHLYRKGYPVTIWGAFSDYINFLKKSGENKKFLPGIKIPDGIKLTDDLRQALEDKELIILAIPSQYLRCVLKKVKKQEAYGAKIYLSVIKGIEVSTLKRMSQVIHDELGNIKLAVLSGPTIAHEVALGLPSTALIASRNIRLRRYLQGIFMDNKFRIYTSKDIIGVELGGSLKNVIAIACGISDGLRFGTNTKAALLSRGLAEISRLGQTIGASVKTFSGITGLGDLVTTCISSYSRNRFVGEQIGKGKNLQYIKKHMQMVAEGVPTTKSAYELSLKYGIDMPITKETYLVLYKNKPPLKAVKDLMARKGKEE